MATLNPSQEQLETWYVREHRSTREIAKLIGASQPWARKLLHRHGIPMRSYKDNPMPTPKGGTLSKSHRERIAASMAGNANWLDQKTGQHRNFQRQEVACAECGAPVEKRRCDIQKYNKSFCSHECHGKWRAKQIGPLNPKWKSAEVPCAECGKAVIRAPSHSKHNKNAFCSRECHNEWRSKHQTGATRYNWEGGYDPYYGESWPAAKRAARKRDKCCQNCGRTPADTGKALDVHHKIRFRRFGVDRHKEANDLANLICYCARCHKLIEERDKRKQSNATSET